MRKGKEFRIPIVAAGALLLAACVPGPVELGPAASAGPVVCDTGCSVAWQRAQFWIVAHSHYKIQTTTDVLIQTYNPGEHSSQYGFTATREPLGDGKYRIALSASCVDILRMCNPRAEDIEAAFNYYVATGRDVFVEKGQRYTAIR